MDRTSWPCTAITLAALSDELTKIASDAPAQKKPHWAREVGKGVLAAGLGAGAGTGAAMLLEKKLPHIFLEKNEKLAPAMNIALPILGAATFYVGNRYRERMKEHFKHAPGYPKEDR